MSRPPKSIAAPAPFAPARHEPNAIIDLLSCVLHSSGDEADDDVEHEELLLARDADDNKAWAYVRKTSRCEPCRASSIMSGK